jgi:hypothetical protein
MMLGDLLEKIAFVLNGPVHQFRCKPFEMFCLVVAPTANLLSEISLAKPGDKNGSLDSKSSKSSYRCLYKSKI